MKELDFDDDCFEDRNEGERKEGSNSMVTELLGKIISEIGEIKENLNFRLEKENKIEESLKNLTSECKSLIDQVVVLNANMMYMKRVVRIIDSKFNIDLDKKETMEDKEEFKESTPEDTIFGNRIQMVEDLIPSKQENIVGGLKQEKVQTPVKAMSKVSDK